MDQRYILLNYNLRGTAKACFIPHDEGNILDSDKETYNRLGINVQEIYSEVKMEMIK